MKTGKISLPCRKIRNQCSLWKKLFGEKTWECSKCVCKIRRSTFMRFIWHENNAHQTMKKDCIKMVSLIIKYRARAVHDWSINDTFYFFFSIWSQIHQSLNVGTNGVILSMLSMFKTNVQWLRRGQQRRGKQHQHWRHIFCFDVDWRIADKAE